MSSTVGGFLVGFGLCLFLMGSWISHILGRIQGLIYDECHAISLTIINFISTTQGVLNWGTVLGTILVIVGAVLLVRARVRRSS